MKINICELEVLELERGGVEGREEGGERRWREAELERSGERRGESVRAGEEVGRIGESRGAGERGREEALEIGGGGRRGERVEELERRWRMKSGEWRRWTMEVEELGLFFII